jgi:ubiquinol-cytochrome c reductase subunit 6
MLTFCTSSVNLGHLGVDLSILRCNKCFRGGPYGWLPLKKKYFFAYFYTPLEIERPANVMSPHLILLRTSVKSRTDRGNVWLPNCQKALNLLLLDSRIPVVLKEKCQQTKECQKYYEELQVCTNRVSSKSNTAETCAQELYDFIHCTDHCVSNSTLSSLAQHNNLGLAVVSWVFILESSGKILDLHVEKNLLWSLKSLIYM